MKDSTFFYIFSLSFLFSYLTCFLYLYLPQFVVPPAPADYITVNQRLSFSTSITSKNTTITIIDDSIKESHEEFSLLLTKRQYYILSPKSARVLILNDDGVLSCVCVCVCVCEFVGVGMGMGVGVGVGTQVLKADSHYRRNVPSHCFFTLR